MSSLAAQLAQNSSLNAALLVDRSRRKATLSYLFTGREADQHDLEAIHALGVNSLLHLASVNPALERYEDELFSDSAKDTDRTLLPTDRIKELDRNIEEFLWLLSPVLLEPPAGKILEWLVRRFRIHEFNVEATLSLFLPYHESPHFAKMITILQIKPNSKWSFLIPYKSAAQNLPRVSLVTEMLKNSDIARFVTSLLPSALKKGLSHHVLLAFNAATLHDFIKRSKTVNEGTVAYLLPALLEPLKPGSRNASKDAVLGSCILFASLSQKCELSAAALKVVVGSMISCGHLIRGDQLVSALVAVCEPQTEIEVLPDIALKTVLSIPDIADALASGSGYAGSEKVLGPLVKGLCDRLEDNASLSLLEGIIATPATLPTVLEILTMYLLSIGINSETQGQTPMMTRRLLASIQQRHPKALIKSSDALREEESLKEAVDQLIISLSMTGRAEEVNSTQKGADLALASVSADENVRMVAVKALIESINGKDLSAIENMETIRSVLVARVQDTSVAVLEALYEYPAALTPIFASNAKEYHVALSSVIAPHAKTKRNVLRLHLSYLVTSFWASADAATQQIIFHDVLFPFLLFSKARQKTVELVWSLIDILLVNPAANKSVSDWLAGCSTFISSSEDTSPVESMNQINFNISGKIADNIMKCDRFSEYVDSVLGKLQDPHPHTRLMGYLVVLSLVKKLEGSHQIEIANKALDVMDVAQFSGIDDMSQEHLTLGSEGEISLGKYIITKPNSKTALNWIQVSVVAAISRIPRPAKLVIDWTAEATSSAPERGSDYVSLMRSVYQVANASATRLPILSTSLLQILFVTLKDDALAFLAGIWSIGTKQGFEESRPISLLHAAAFLEAHIQEEDGVDFQTILPSLLVALQSSESQISQGALECISRVRILANTKLASVYRFDTIYGENDRTLQYLDQNDLKLYLNALVEHRDHFGNDPTYLKVFHEEHLGRTNTDKKKNVDYKHHIVCYLISHINAISSESSRNSLLKSIGSITNKDKIRILFPTIQAMVEKASAVPPTDIFKSTSEELTTRILSCFDSTVAVYLNDTTTAWDVFLQVVRTYFRPESPLSPQQALVHSIENGLFATLNQRRKTALCEVLLEVGSEDSSAQSSSRSLLSTILVDVPLIVHLLDEFAPSAPASSPRVSKRAKMTESPNDALPRLSLLVEILGSKSLPGSLDLIANLLDTLSKVVQILPPTQADVSYIEQLLMSAIESAASKINEVPNLSPSVIRLDILVEVIRVSVNPQTFHQALLLIANLARLAPESVLYNVMPVFTFMGSNVFHRDDSYSFKVVQQTIDGIVPVMVSSLKEVHSQPIDLYLASKEFLRVFTDAANHIPRHRRNNFFAHLVDVLGFRDFSAPVCMLLLEKSANRIIRQTSEEIYNLLYLPLSVFQHSGYDSQIHTAAEILSECRRIVAHIVDPTSSQPIFLESTPDGDSISSATILRRRAQALVIFTGFAFKPKASNTAALQTEGSISSVVAQLITLATLPEGGSAETKIEDVCEAARASMSKLLNSMTVIDFVDAVQTMLKSGDDKVQAGALELLAKRLLDVSTKMRSNISASIMKILMSIKDLLAIRKDGKIVIHALFALKSIAATLCAGEESLLTDLISNVLAATNENFSLAAALSALSTMCVKLGPRIIPFFRNIISRSIIILRGTETVLYEDAFCILQGLLVTIPTFWGGSEVTQMVLLCIDQPSSASKPSGSGFSTLSRSLAKRTPATVLLPTLLDMWQGLQASRNLSKISAYFDIISKALRHADRPKVLEHLRNLFKILLEAMDITKVDEEARTCVISAFKELTVKLNEAAFKPLFRRLYDWGFVEDTNDNARKVTFCHLYINLLDFFKGLMVPYMAFLLQPFSDILTSFKTFNSDNFTLWSSLVQILTRTLNFDEGGFWRDDKLRQISVPLTAQIELCVKANFVNGKAQLQDCFAALIDSVIDDTLLKSINLNILMNTRSEDAHVRIFALASCEALWRANGGKLNGFVAETATFIAECGEDENDMVVRESFKLKDAVESVAGKIDGL